jgi:membrane-associated protease RseP (regulator of RpoE activity)
MEHRNLLRETAAGGGEPIAPPSSTQHQPFKGWQIHVVLFLLALASTTLFGGLFFGWLPAEQLTEEELSSLILSSTFIVEGLKFSIPLMLILLCHEMGHYLACRRHGLPVSLPYFIPAPLGIGTLGAVIWIKKPIRNKRQLIEVGAAGPIAGFVALLPFLVYGVANARIMEIEQPAEGFVWIFGEPLIFRGLHHFFHPEMAAGMDINLHPCGWAAWFGLFITLLNLLPFAQLDGGHITYAMLGRHHRVIVWWLLAVLVCLGFVWFGWWIWAAFAILLGVEHPRVYDEEMPLERDRLLLGWVTIVIFVLCFMAVPFQQIGP